MNLESNGTAPDEASALAEKLQNPIADLISLPFQNNTDFHVGPQRGVQDILNIQPVIPIHVNEDWNVITRTILPLVWSPSFQPDASVPPFGLAPVTFSAFASPVNTFDGWTFGAGPIVELPTGTNKNLGSNVWGLGPAVVGVRTVHPWVYGLLVNTVFSLGGTSGSGGTKYTLTTINPFINYNFGGGWFIGTSMVTTANWDAPGEKWTLPVGLQGGRLIKVGGKLPVDLVVGAYYNALRPEGAGTWDLRTQVTFIF
ncbi:MAG: neuromedin U [Proteobacteria bacterium]|nr:neuromedin U [Pseudomonadota bacterium]